MLRVLWVVTALAVCQTFPVTSDLPTNVFSAGESGYFCIKIPDLLPLASGDILAFGEARMQSCSDFAWTDLVIKTSSDNGTSWSALRVLVSNSSASEINVIGNAAPVQLKTGRILVPYCQNNRKVWLTSSDDGGKTWATPRALPNVVDASWRWVGLGPPSSIQLDTNRILTPSYHTTLIHGDGELSHGHVMYSDDDGESWHIGARRFGGIHLSNECQAVDLGNNTVLINARTFGTHRIQTVSHDGGLTFGPSVEVNGLRESWEGCEGSILRHGDRLFFTNPAAHGIYREKMSLFTSTDNGATWELVKTIDSGPSGYSALANLPDGRVVLLYERSKTRRVIFVPDEISFIVVFP